MDRCIARATPKHLRQRDRTDDHGRPTDPRGRQIGTSPWIACRKFRESLAVQYEGAAGRYSASGHTAPASAKNSSGIGP